MYPHPPSATAGSIAGSARPPETSLIQDAPPAMDASATVARVVSTETATPASASARTTGTTRSSSTRSGTRAEPGRVDSPPTSRMSAPSATMSKACAIAASASAHRPPSENESSVTFSTPMTSVRAGASWPAISR